MVYSEFGITIYFIDYYFLYTDSIMKPARIFPELNEREVDIDFEQASLLWMANKRRLKNGMYRYICCTIMKTGKRCQRKPVLNNEHCRIHTTEVVPSVFHSAIPMAKDVISEKHKSAGEFIDSIIDTNKKIINIPSNPQIIRTFEQMYEQMDHYVNFESISTIEQIESKCHQLEDVAWFYVMVWAFLEGLKQLTKLETKQIGVVRLKDRLLVFFGYNSIEYIHATTAKWTRVSELIENQIIDVLRYLVGDL